MTALKLAIIALLLYLFVKYYNYERNTIRIKHYPVFIKNLPDIFHGFKIMHLSDLHSKRFGKLQEQLLREIRKQKFDIVALTGDFVDKIKRDPLPALELFDGLAGAPVYFVRGNHEYKAGFDEKQYADIGVKVLNNTAVKIERDGQKIWLLGVDDPHDHRDRLDLALAGTDKSAKILLAHSPNVFPKAIKCGIDLLLAGHTHGGQVRFPLIGAIMAPGQGLFPKWDYGLYKEGDTTMVINPGLGESDLPIRLNIKPEIGIVTLMGEFHCDDIERPIQ